MAVERSGQPGVGLKRDDSGEPSMTKRRPSFSINEEAEPQATAERKQSIATEMEARKQSAVIDEIIPENAILTPATTPTLEENKQLGIPTGKEENEDIVKPAKADGKKVANGGQKSNGAIKPTTAKTVERPAATKTATKPSPISTAKTTTSSKAFSDKPKSPLPKTPTTPNKPRPKDAAANIPEKKPERKPSRASLAPSHPTRPASKPPTAAAHGSAPKTRIPASPPQTGFHKPRPKSPTKPVKLPASLTAHTASSGSKAATAAPPSRQSLSRASGSVQAGATRSPSRATTTSKSGLTKNPSTLRSSSSRPSLGPPPNTLKKQPSRTNLPQNAPPADEGFLARMMRPTTASASKTAEKPPTTPPKRSQSVKRPVTRDGPPKHEPSKGSPAHKAHKETTVKTVAKPVSKVSESDKVTEEPKVEKATPIIEPAVTDISKAPEAPAEKTEDAPVEKAIEEVTVEQPEVVKVDEPKVEEPVTSEPAKEEQVIEEKADLIETSPAAVEEPTEIPETIEEEPTEPESTEKETVVVEEADITPDAPAVPEIQIEQEETKPVEPVVAPLETKAEIEEDPEDVKAREEIAKINAEFARAALEEEAK